MLQSHRWSRDYIDRIHDTIPSGRDYIDRIHYAIPLGRDYKDGIHDTIPTGRDFIDRIHDTIPTINVGERSDQIKFIFRDIKRKKIANII